MKTTDEQIKEILERTRRVETALCRHVSGKPDQRGNNYTTKASYTDEGYEVDVNSMSISLHEVVAAARNAGCAGEDFVVNDNGKPRLIVREITS